MLQEVKSSDRVPKKAASSRKKETIDPIKMVTSSINVALF